MRYHRVSQKKKGDTNIMVPQVEVALDAIDIYVISLYELKSGHNPKDVAVDSTMVKPCQDHRAQLQRKRHDKNNKK